ncbi:hypothetical protein K438DRAFT_2169018 [Mycena galopus ATCC 62051]|nr:hypothetical protein K438DRAFT_2169018 [Mycena galopus ATCC 62051]
MSRMVSPVGRASRDDGGSAAAARRDRFVVVVVAVVVVVEVGQRAIADVEEEGTGARATGHVEGVSETRTPVKVDILPNAGTRAAGTRAGTRVGAAFAGARGVRANGGQGQRWPRRRRYCCSQARPWLRRCCWCAGRCAEAGQHCYYPELGRAALALTPRKWDAGGGVDQKESWEDTQGKNRTEDDTVILYSHLVVVRVAVVVAGAQDAVVPARVERSPVIHAVPPGVPRYTVAAARFEVAVANKCVVVAAVAVNMLPSGPSAHVVAARAVAGAAAKANYSEDRHKQKWKSSSSQLVSPPLRASPQSPPHFCIFRHLEVPRRPALFLDAELGRHIHISPLLRGARQGGLGRGCKGRDVPWPAVHRGGLECVRAVRVQWLAGRVVAVVEEAMVTAAVIEWTAHCGHRSTAGRTCVDVDGVAAPLVVSRP